ncbi:MAG: DUF92 domain-containing protein [Bacteroidia bacterium]|jgi:uncharacterized protein (TIGR00297 family)|nr:DUF92 domain-containing protein [Bacteroidia bacterium]
MLILQSSGKVCNFALMGLMDFPYTLHLVLIIVLVLITHYWGKYIPAQIFFARKVLHIGAISCVAHATEITHMEYREVFEWIVLGAALILSLAVYLGFFNKDKRKSWGIAFFPWVLWVMLVSVPLAQYEHISFAFWILAWADGFSAIVGRLWGKAILWRGKTLMGTVTFMVVTLWLCWLMPIVPKPWFPMEFAGILMFALSIAMVEVLGDNGTDNIWIPIWAFIWSLNIEIFTQFMASINGFYFYLIAVFGLSYWVWKHNWLDISGLFSALLLFLTLFIARIDWVPLVLFFVLGSLASKFNKTQASDVKHGKARDVFQVLANAGPIWLLAVLALFWNLERTNLFVLSVMSAALSDTLSSEFGIRWGDRPFSIVTGKPIPVGVSGGVTWIGFGGAILGALLMALFGLIFRNITVMDIVFIVVLGVLGSVLDSFLGYWLQEKAEVNGEWTDIVSSNDTVVKGIKGVNNDAINALTLTIISVVSALIWLG